MNRTDDKWANYIIASAEEIINHAEQWVQDIKYQTGIDINIRIRPDEFPEVECTTTMIPRGVVTALDKHREEVAEAARKEAEKWQIMET